MLALVAQLVERGAYTSVVPGSSPGGRTNKKGADYDNYLWKRKLSTILYEIDTICVITHVLAVKYVLYERIY